MQRPRDTGARRFGGIWCHRGVMEGGWIGSGADSTQWDSGVGQGEIENVRARLLDDV